MILRGVSILLFQEYFRAHKIKCYSTLIGEVRRTSSHIDLYFVYGISYSVLIFINFTFYYEGYYRKKHEFLISIAKLV